MSDGTIKLTLTPAQGVSDDVALADFLSQVEATRDALQAAYGRPEQELDIRIVGLSMNSPASITLEPRWRGAPVPAAVDAFAVGAKSAFLHGAADAGLPRRFFDSLKDLSRPIGAGVSTLAVVANNQRITVDVESRKRIDAVFEPDTTTSGVVDGMLESVNLHNKQNVCNLYPEIGAQRIRCRFTKDLFETKVRPSLGKYVKVYGELKYRWRDPFPYQVYVEDVEVLPDVEDMPTFAEILGMAPDATGGVPSEVFVSETRYDWS